MLSNRRIGRCRKEESPIFFVLWWRRGIVMMSQDVVRMPCSSFQECCVFFSFSLLICKKKSFLTTSLFLLLWTNCYAFAGKYRCDYCSICMIFVDNLYGIICRLHLLNELCTKSINLDLIS